MTTDAHELTDGDARTSARMSRRITATWWYTFVGVLGFECLIVLLLLAALLGDRHSAGSLTLVLVTGVAWLLTSVPVLLDYRTRADAATATRWRRAAPALVVALVFGIAGWSVTGVWLVALVPLVETLLLLKWPPGIRLRLVIVATAILVALWIVDARLTIPSDTASPWLMLSFFCVLLPAMTVATLWWWDILVALDNARASEARLGATQERLRVATDVHDLQGHHLQVIALQLELAERLMAPDPDSALAHLQAARASVDDARQGTRDLALRFRSSSLTDELANAVDLLRAAGMSVEAAVPERATGAPADVLAPVVRETTTNALRHGRGNWAKVALSNQGDDWRFEISNDADAGAAPSESGTGLDGIRRRTADAGGTVEVRPERHSFTVVVTVPGAPE